MGIGLLKYGVVWAKSPLLGKNGMKPDFTELLQEFLEENAVGLTVQEVIGALEMAKLAIFNDIGDDVLH